MNLKFESKQAIWLYEQLCNMGFSFTGLENIADSDFVFTEEMLHRYIYDYAESNDKIYRYIIYL